MIELFSIFVTVFLAEFGDKTQLATVLFAGEGKHSPWMVAAAAGGALVLSTILAVVVGTLAARHLQGVPLKLLAGIGFILIGAWSVWEHFQQASG
jgi:putative Ca2+/H+ antiporter (TMEM165/GDT1 family)